MKESLIGIFFTNRKSNIRKDYNMNTKKMISSALAVMLVLSMTACSGKDMPDKTASGNADKVSQKAVEEIEKPDGINASDVAFTDHFVSDKTNNLTIEWPSKDDATSYEITMKKTGTTGKESVIKKVKDTKAKTVYNGTDTKVKTKINRNTVYLFRIRINTNKGYSDWTDISYFPSTTDNSDFAKSMNLTTVPLDGKDESGKNAWKAHGNVLYLTKDYNYISSGTRVDMVNLLNDSSIPLILDLSGHSIECKEGSGILYLHSSYSGFIITDSIGNGKISCKKWFHPETQNGKGDYVIINNGIFLSQIVLDALKAKINGGTFNIISNTMEYDAYHIKTSDGKYAPISEAILNGTDELIINGGKYILNDGVKINDKNNLMTNISSDKYYKSKFTVNGTLKLSDDKKIITLEK